ncbi:helix-turn-helix transcriptional regulator [Streptomyces sp. NPDC102274]|uniref:helix-turn-helix transcriptional regulator n=1 Tax=Streptomyces sp. NPDC102274 TaxID=3366151 RepID=UPI003814D87B
MDTNDELRDFLRARRARLKPEEAGLTPADKLLDQSRSRRVPGLRREEIAQLAGVSVDYYARLEQGRARHVSEPILVAIADVLRLNTTERAYFFALATQHARPAAHAGPSTVPRLRPAIHRMLEEFNSPALVLGRGLQILAMNRLARSFLFDMDTVPARDRNLAKWIFLAPEARRRYVDWESNAADMAAVLRAEAGASPDDRLVSDLVGELAVKSHEFRRMWAEHHVSACLNGVMRIRHPDVGVIEVEYEALQVHGDQDQKLILYAAPEDSPSAEALSLLASWTARPSLPDHGLPRLPGLPATSTPAEHHDV